MNRYLRTLRTVTLVNLSDESALQEILTEEQIRIITQLKELIRVIINNDSDGFSTIIDNIKKKELNSTLNILFYYDGAYISLLALAYCCNNKDAFEELLLCHKVSLNYCFLQYDTSFAYIEKNVEDILPKTAKNTIFHFMMGPMKYLKHRIYVLEYLNLLEYAIDRVNVNSLDVGNYSVVDLCYLNDMEEVVDFFVRNGAKLFNFAIIEQVSKWLMFAVMSDDFKKFETLISIGVNLQLEFTFIINHVKAMIGNIHYLATDEKYLKYLQRIVAADKTQLLMQDKSESKNTPLMHAVKSNNLIGAKEIVFLAFRQDLYKEVLLFQNKDGYTALMMAACYSLLRMVREIIGQIKKIILPHDPGFLSQILYVANREGNDILRIAMINKNNDIANFLLNEYLNDIDNLKAFLRYKNNNGNTILMLAVKSDNVGAVKEIITAAQKLDMVTEVILERNNGNVSALNSSLLLLDMEIFELLLNLLTEKQQQKEIDYALTLRDAKRRSVLTNAVLSKSFNGVVTILDLAKKNDKLDEILNDTDVNEKTALYASVLTGAIDMFSILLKNGADLTLIYKFPQGLLKDKGTVLEMVALSKNNVCVLQDVKEKLNKIQKMSAYFIEEILEHEFLSGKINKNNALVLRYAFESKNIYASTSLISCYLQKKLFLQVSYTELSLACRFSRAFFALELVKIIKLQEMFSCELTHADGSKSFLIHQYLLKCQDVNDLNTMLSYNKDNEVLAYRNTAGETPMMVAIKMGRKDFAVALMNAGSGLEDIFNRTFFKKLSCSQQLLCHELRFEEKVKRGSGRRSLEIVKESATDKPFGSLGRAYIPSASRKKISLVLARLSAESTKDIKPFSGSTKSFFL